MIIIKIEPLIANYTLKITTDDNKVGVFDVTPYLDLEAFASLKEVNSFKKVNNGGYFVEWDCGADLSADTIEAYLKEPIPLFKNAK